MATTLLAYSLYCSVGSVNDHESEHGEPACQNSQPELTSPPPSEVVDIGGEYGVPIVFCEEEDSLPCTSQALSQAAGMAVPPRAGAIDCLLCIEEVLQAFCCVALPPSTAA